MQAPTPEIRRPSRSEAEAVGAALATAFDADPVTRFMVPDHDYRRRVASLFTFETLLAPRGSWVAVADGVIAGAALWGLPGHGQPGLLATLRHSPWLFRTFGRAFLPAYRNMRFIESVHPKSPKHWYLQTLGAAVPGRGIGGALLRHGLARADADGTPVYLESSSPGNVPVYERFGFRATRDIVLPDGPTLTAMWREPVGASD